MRSVSRVILLLALSFGMGPSLFAQFGSNATKLRGVNICAGTPSNSQVLTYSSSNGCWQASAAAGGGAQTPGCTWIDSGGLVAGFTCYYTFASACTISGWSIEVNAGTATVDVWKIATGTAVPTISNTITASAIPAISTGTAVRSSTLTAWTTSVSAGDIVGFNLKVVATATQVHFNLECQ